MNASKHGIRFWIGNAILAVALVTLFYIDALSERLGIWAMVAWMALAALGVYVLTSDKTGPAGLTD